MKTEWDIIDECLDGLISFKEAELALYNLMLEDYIAPWDYQWDFNFLKEKVS